MNDTAQSDQQSAAARERVRQEHQAVLDGEPVTLRTITVETDPGELEAVERGEMPAGIQVQIDRQLAEDVAISAMEREL